MKIIAIILFTITAIALVVLISSAISIIRWHNVKEMQRESRGPLIISALVLLASIAGGYWAIAPTPKIAIPAVQTKDPALPGGAKKTTKEPKKTAEKPKGTMVNTFSNAKQYPYQQLIASDNFASKAFGLNQAQVVQVGDSKGHSFALAFDTSAPNDFYIIVFKDKQLLKVGNNLNVTGILGKRTTYQTGDKQTKTVPTIYAVQSSISGQ